MTKLIIIKCDSENKLNFTHSVKLGPTIVKIITKNKNKIDVPVVTEVANSCLPSQQFIRLVIF